MAAAAQSFPLIAIGIGIGWLYAVLGFDVRRFWVGSGLAFAGAVLALTATSAGGARSASPATRPPVTTH